jgi:ABC-type thiamin/hydroxymethylpyrimidine transport system permease subunit
VLNQNYTYPSSSVPAVPSSPPVILWVYVLTIGLLGAVEGGLGLLVDNANLWEYAAGQVIGTIIYILPPLLALVFTKRPGAALLTYVLGRLIAGHFSNVNSILLAIPIGLAFELTFIFLRYKRFDVQFLLISALMADAVAYGLDAAYGYKLPFSAVMFIVIGDILGAFAAWVFGRVLKRV